MVVAVWIIVGVVVINSVGLFRHVEPPQLNRNSIRAAWMIAKNLRVGSDLAISEGNGRLCAETRVARSNERFLARWRFTIAIHDMVVMIVDTIVAVFVVVGRLVLGGGMIDAASAPMGQVKLEQECIDVGQQSSASHG